MACFRPRRSPCGWTAPKPSPPAPKAPREQPRQPIAEPFGRACAALAYLGLKLLLLLVQVGRGRHVVPPDPELVFLGVPGPRGTGGLTGQPLPGPPGPIRSCFLALASPAARAAIGLLPPGRAEHLCRQPLPTLGTRPNGGRVKQAARCPQQRTPSPSPEGASYGFSGGGSWRGQKSTHPPARPSRRGCLNTPAVLGVQTRAAHVAVEDLHYNGLKVLLQTHTVSNPNNSADLHKRPPTLLPRWQRCHSRFCALQQLPP